MTTRDPRPPHQTRRGGRISEEARSLLARVMERQGRQELAAAHLFASTLPLAPTLDDKLLLVDHAREELLHFEAIAGVYEELGAGDLFKAVAAAASNLPAPRSWVEAVVVACFFDRAPQFAFDAFRSSSYAPLANVVARIVDDEIDHQAAAEKTLADLCAMSPQNRELAQDCVNRWLPICVGMVAVRDPTSERAERLGLKAHVEGDPVDALLADARAILARCGLVLPGRLQRRAPTGG